MPETNVGTASSHPETLPKSGLNRRDILRVIAAVGFATAAYGVKIPTEKEVNSAYGLLAKDRAQKFEGYANPVESYPAGDWDLVSTSEEPIALFEDGQKRDSDYGIPIEKILENQRIIEFTKGAYTFINRENRNKRCLVHLGLHGQHDPSIVEQYSRAPITIEKPNLLGAISIDSIYSFSAWQEMGTLNTGQKHRPIELARVRSEIVINVERALTLHVGDWIQNLDDSTVILATDIPKNEAVMWEVFHEAVGNPSAYKIFEDLGPLKQSAEFMSAVATASSAGEMIQNLLRRRTTRKDFLKLPLRLAKIGMASAAIAVSIKPVRDFYNSHTNLLRQIDESFINSRVNLKVRERKPEDFLGRVETLLQKDPTEVSLYEVFFTLRDLTSSYKELVIAEDGVYCQNGRNDFMSAWGLSHDTKLGLFSTTRGHVLDLIRRFAQHFGAKIDLCFTQNPENPEWKEKVNRSTLWTAMGYKTKLTPEGRKIESADIWQFPELEDIF